MKKLLTAILGLFVFISLGCPKLSSKHGSTGSSNSVEGEFSASHKPLGDGNPFQGVVNSTYYHITEGSEVWDKILVVVSNEGKTEVAWFKRESLSTVPEIGSDFVPPPGSLVTDKVYMGISAAIYEGESYLAYDFPPDIASGANDRTHDPNGYREQLRMSLDVSSGGPKYWARTTVESNAAEATARSIEVVMFSTKVAVISAHYTRSTIDEFSALRFETDRYQDLSRNTDPNVYYVYSGKWTDSDAPSYLISVDRNLAHSPLGGKIKNLYSAKTRFSLTPIPGRLATARPWGSIGLKFSNMIPMVTGLCSIAIEGEGIVCKIRNGEGPRFDETHEYESHIYFSEPLPNPE